jgi:hypothetical protein
VHIRDALLLCFCKGHAQHFGLIHDLNASKLQYKWAVLIFYFAYVSNKSECGNNSLEANFHELFNDLKRYLDVMCNTVNFINETIPFTINMDC